MLTDLVRAELVKTWRRPLEFYLSLFIIGFSCCAPIVLTVMALLRPDHYFRSAQMYLSFPFTLEIGASALALVDVLVIGLFVASAVGSEYTAGTWKMVLPRRPARAPFVVVKALVAFGACYAVVGTALFSWTVLSWLCLAYGLQLGPAATAAVFDVRYPTALLIMSSLSILVYGSIAIPVTIASRSALAGVAASVLAPAVLKLLTSDLNALAMPNAHLQNIRVALLGGSTSAAILREVYGVSVSAAVSAAYLALTAIGLTMLGIAIFQRQDITG